MRFFVIWVVRVRAGKRLMPKIWKWKTWFKKINKKSRLCSMAPLLRVLDAHAWWHASTIIVPVVLSELSSRFVSWLLCEIVYGLIVSRHQNLSQIISLHICSETLPSYTLSSWVYVILKNSTIVNFHFEIFTSSCQFKQRTNLCVSSLTSVVISQLKQKRMHVVIITYSFS